MDSRLVVRTCEDAWRLYRDRHIAAKSAAPERQDFAWQNLAIHFGKMLIEDVDWNATEDYVAKRIAGDIGRPSVPGTVRRELAEFIAAIRWCAHRRRKLISPDIVPDFDLPEDCQPRERWLSDRELEQFFRTAATSRKKCPALGGIKRLTRVERFGYIGLETGARREAIVGLTWDRVDFEMNVIHFHDPARRRTKKHRAAVPMSSLLRRVLERAYVERINDLVMDNRGGIWAPLQHVVLKAGLAPNPAKVKAGTKPKATGISPHVFRHTAATRMLRRNVSTAKVARVLGNSQRMIEKTYGHLVVSDLQSAVETISGVEGYGADLGG